MKLSKRIYALAEKVDKDESVADIGTDHGYVPMLLIRNNISPFVIMSDISEGSLSKARETFAMTGLRCEEDWFRVGDGLETISSGETDAVIIAGLGGHTIADILAADLQKSRSFKRLILQPRKHSGSLRFFLYTNGWDIESESLAEEGKFACEIITAVPADLPEATDAPAALPETGGSGLSENLSSCHREPPYPEDDIRWKYPQSIVDADPELAKMRIDWKIGSIEEQLANLQKSSGNVELIERLQRDHKYLSELLL